MSLVEQAITAIYQKPAAPLANGVFGDAEFGSPQICLASRPHIAGSRGTAQIATAQHGDDGLASPSTLAPAHSAPRTRSAGLSHLHSPQALSSKVWSATL